MPSFLKKLPVVRGYKALKHKHDKHKDKHSKHGHGHDHGGKSSKSHFSTKGGKNYFRGEPLTYHAGKKYSRLFQLKNLTDQQQHLLDKFMEYVPPEKFESPYGFRKGMEALRHALDFDQVSPVETAGAQYLQNIMNQPIESDPEYLRNLEAQAMRQYNEEIIPSIAERFSGLGALNSSAFQQAAAQSGASLAERLAAMRGEFGQNERQFGLQQQGMGLNAANMAMGYGQLPFQRNLQRANIAQGLMGESLIPQQYQNVYNQQALQRQLQQRMAVLGTPAFNYMNIMPGNKRTGPIAAAIPGLATGIGAGLGALAGSALLPGAGTAAGAAAGAGIGQGVGSGVQRAMYPSEGMMAS